MEMQEHQGLMWLKTTITFTSLHVVLENNIAFNTSNITSYYCISEELNVANNVDHIYGHTLNGDTHLLFPDDSCWLTLLKTQRVGWHQTQQTVESTALCLLIVSGIKCPWIGLQGCLCQNIEHFLKCTPSSFYSAVVKSRQILCAVCLLNKAPQNSV